MKWWSWWESQEQLKGLKLFINGFVLLFFTKGMCESCHFGERIFCPRYFNFARESRWKALRVLYILCNSYWEINSNIYTSILYSVSLFMQFSYSSSISFIPFQSEDIGQNTNYFLLILLLGIIIFPSKKYAKYKISEKQRNVFTVQYRSKVLILHTFLSVFHLVTNPTTK